MASSDSGIAALLLPCKAHFVLHILEPNKEFGTSVDSLSRCKASQQLQSNLALIIDAMTCTELRGVLLAYMPIKRGGYGIHSLSGGAATHTPKRVFSTENFDSPLM